MLSVKLYTFWEIIERLCAKKYIPVYIIINLIGVDENYIFFLVFVL